MIELTGSLSGVERAINESVNPPRQVRIKFDKLKDDVCLSISLYRSATLPDEFVVFTIDSIKNGDVEKWCHDGKRGIGQTITNEFIQKLRSVIQSYDIRMVGDMVEKFSGFYEFPKWIKDGDYTAEYTDDGWYLVKCPNERQ